MVRYALAAQTVSNLLNLPSTNGFFEETKC